jgi:Tfp pilus assembly protein PilV
MAARAGASLIELLVAVTLLGVVLTSLAGLSFDAARRSIRVAGSGYMQGVVTQEVNRLTALPFNQLPAAGGCIAVTSGIFPHKRCVTVTDITSMQRQIQLIVTPAQQGVAPDTVTFVRYNPPSANPLFTP